MKSLFFTFLLLFSLQSFSQDTFSIIAVDPNTGEVGAAGATCLFNQNDGIIDIISSLIPGKGGILSQAYVCIPNINLQNGIDQMNNGLSPDEIIDTYSIQGNILLDQSVIDNMENNFNNTEGSLAEKLMSAMQGANFAGADSRCLDEGTSSATAFLIVYQPDDIVGQPSLELNVGSQQPGVEPINVLQDMFDNYLSLDSNNEEQMVKLFPNPSNGIVNLNSFNMYKIDVFDVTGKNVLTTIGNSVNIHSLEKGTYVFKLKNIQSSAISTYKIVKQ